MLFLREVKDIVRGLQNHFQFKETLIFENGFYDFSDFLRIAICP